jgi:hypothetical protein
MSIIALIFEGSLRFFTIISSLSFAAWANEESAQLLNKKRSQ